MGKRLVREDEFGLYVRTGGYAFRPAAVAKQEFFPEDILYATSAADYISLDGLDVSQLVAGQRVNAAHVAGTTTARVHNERWVSSSIDPRYVECTKAASETTARATGEESTNG